MDSHPGAFESRDRQWGMYGGKVVFSQVVEPLPVHQFQKCVARYGGDYKSRGFSCRDQFLCMRFAQLTFRESLRDIEACLRSVPEKLYHLGFRGRIPRSTLADANETRDWRICADFAQSLFTSHARCMHPKRSVRTTTPPSTHWTLPPSISASQCFRGPIFAIKRLR